MVFPCSFTEFHHPGGPPFATWSKKAMATILRNWLEDRAPHPRILTRVNTILLSEKRQTTQMSEQSSSSGIPPDGE
eukprot:s698_g14.t1